MADTSLDNLAEAHRDLLRAAPFPDWTPPMLATLTQDRFSDPEWIFERKLDGVRCLASRPARGPVRLRSRNEKAMERTYPEIAEAISGHTSSALVVDGEVVAMEGRRTSFSRLQGRIGIDDPAAALATGIAVVYYVFDLLHLDGYDTTALPLLERKKLLKAAIDFGGPLRFSTHRRTVGEKLFAEACARGDEGVMAKRADAPYRAGRSDAWLKFKCAHDQELVVGGYTDPKGSRVGFGALLVGYQDGPEFVYAGKVGTGFGARNIAALLDRLQPLGEPVSPFTSGSVRETGVHWVRPQVVAQIGFAEWTRDGLLRQPRYLGLREDKRAEDVTRET